MNNFPFDIPRGIKNGDDANLDDLTVQKLIFGDGTDMTTASSGGGGGGEVSALSFDTGTRSLELQQTTGTTPLTVNIPNNKVNALTFNTGSRLLQLSQDIGVSHQVNIPVNSVSSASYNSGTGVLNIVQTDAPSVQATITASSNINVIHNGFSNSMVRKLKSLEDKLNQLDKPKLIKIEKLKGKDRLLRKKNKI